jgi:superoxide dismutase, Fe-Mn family
MEGNVYTLTPLGFGYDELVPVISEEQLRLHHTKHHQAYVNGANALLEAMDKSRKDGTDIDQKAVLKALSFNIGGHVLHSLFWGNLAPEGSVERLPQGALKDEIERQFGGIDRMKKEFSSAAASVEGSGWAVLAYDSNIGRLLLMQIEKHNVNLAPGLRLLIVLDVWEHAYYLDYKNDRAKYVEAFWRIVNWGEVERRFEVLRKS